MPKRRWKSHIVLMLTGLCVALVLGEVGLRVVGISYPMFYQYDTQLGVSLRPGAEGLLKKEGEAYSKINSAGLRDRDHALMKSSNSFRIAVLGDSYAEAMQVPMEEAFGAVLERELKGCPSLDGRRPEVVNFGVSGYGTAQESLMLRYRVWPYDPDMVILTFLSGNDVRNNSRALERDEFRPYFRIANGRLVPDFTFRESFGFRLRQTDAARWLYRLRSSSRILQVFGEAMGRINALVAQVASRKFESQDAHAADHTESDSVATEWDGYAEAGLDSQVYHEPRDPVWKEAWEVTEGLLAMMHDEVKERGADFLVVTLSHSPQVHPDPAARRAFAKRLGVRDLFYPDFRIRDLGERKDISVLTLAPLFQSYADQHHVFLHGFENSGIGTGHWNKEGHRLAGELIAQNVCANLPEPPVRS